MKGFYKRIVAIALSAGMLMGSANSMTAFGAGQGQDENAISLDLQTGLLDIDYAGYLSQHDVVYNSPIENPADGATVGNGRMGGMIWNENGLTMEVTNVDAAPYTALPSGLINFYTNPEQVPVEGEFQQRLNLYDGTVTTTYGDGLDVTFMGDPDSEVLGIHVSDQREEVGRAYVDLSIWLDKLDAYPEGPFTSRPSGNPSDPMPNKETWTNPEFHYTEDYVAISRGQEDPNNFGYTIAVSVEGADFQTAQVGEGDDQKLQLQIEPARDYTIWIANPTRRQAENHDSKTAAEELLASTIQKGYDALYENFTAYWHDFWSRCFVQYQSDSNSQMDYVENSWYLYQYLIGCGSRGEFPFHFINGVWRWDEQDESMWSWDYTSFNERTFAYTHYATNRLELTDSYYNLFSNNIEGYEEYTHERFYENDGNEKFAELDGSIMAPERHTWNTEQMVGYDGTVNGCPYTTEIYATGPEQAMGLFEKYKYTNDVTYLREKAYPFMKGVCTFIKNFVDVDTDGTYYIKSGHALETYWHQKNPITDLAAFRSILERTIEASEILGVDEELRPVWQDLLDNLAPFKTTAAEENEGEKYLPHDPPASPLMNSQNPELEIVWPFSRTGIGYEDQQTAINTYKERLMPLNIWSPEPIYAARLGLGDDSFANARDMILRSQTHANGIHDDRNGMFESNALIVTAVNEELLQSYNDKIRVFPAVVSDPDFYSKFTLLARNGFLVSSEYANQQVKYISIVSKYGNEATVCNPWEGEEVVITDQSTQQVVASGTQEEFTFPTEEGGIYLVERKAVPVSSFTHETMTGEKNQSMKKLVGANGQTRVLGNVYTQPLTAGEYDERDNNILYVGSWTDEVHVGCYNDTGKYSNQQGAYAEFKFIGKSVQVIMPKAQHQGYFNVYLDGELIAENVDSLDKGNIKQQVVFAVTGISEGVHKLRIEVTGEKDPDSLGAYITMDKIVISDSELSLAEGVTLSAEGGEAAITQPGGALQLKAEITPAEAATAGVSWKVSALDGSSTQAAQIDQNGLLTAKENSTVVVTAMALDGSCVTGSLTVRIRNQDNSTEKWDDRDSRITYTGGWSQWSDSRHYQGTETYNATAGDSFSFEFNGQGFGLIVFGSKRTGMMNIYVDDVLVAEDVDTYNDSNPSGTPQVLAYQNKELTDSTHQVRVEISQNQNPLCEYPEIKLDAIEIYRNGSSVDRDALQMLYDRNKEKEQGSYTDESWQAFQTALEAAAQVLAASDATQEQIDEAESALQKALDGLMENTVNKSTLEYVLGIANGHVEAGDVDKLVPSAQEVFNKVLASAKAVYDDPNATQEQVDTAWKTLMYAIQAMGFVPGDKTELIDLVAEAKALDLNGYEDGAEKDAFTAALTAAEDLIADPDAMELDIDAAYNALNDAMQNLIPKPAAGDKTELKKVIDEADVKNSELDRYVDDAEAKQKFADALAAAKEIYEKDGATQDEIDQAKNNLLDALTGLRLRADKDNLNKWLEDLKSMDLSQYTEESAAVVRAVIAKAEALAAQDLDEDDQGLINAMVAEMAIAKAQLVPADPEDPENPNPGDGSGSGESSNPESSKPNSDASSQNGTNSEGKEATDAVPTTGDATPIAGLSLLAVAAVGTVLLLKKRKN